MSTRGVKREYNPDDFADEAPGEEQDEEFDDGDSGSDFDAPGGLKGKKSKKGEKISKKGRKAGPIAVGSTGGGAHFGGRDFSNMILKVKSTIST